MRYEASLAMTGGKQSAGNKNCHFFHHKSHIDSPEMASVPSRSDTSKNVRIILKWFPKHQEKSVWIGLISLRMQTQINSCEWCSNVEVVKAEYRAV